MLGQNSPNKRTHKMLREIPANVVNTPKLYGKSPSAWASHSIYSITGPTHRRPRCAVLLKILNSQEDFNTQICGKTLENSRFHLFGAPALPGRNAPPVRRHPACFEHSTRVSLDPVRVSWTACPRERRLPAGTDEPLLRTPSRSNLILDYPKIDS